MRKKEEKLFEESNEIWIGMRILLKEVLGRKLGRKEWNNGGVRDATGGGRIKKEEL